MPLVITTTVGPAEVAAGRAYAHDVRLDGDAKLAIGMRVDLRDRSGRLFAGVVTGRFGARRQLTIRPGVTTPTRGHGPTGTRRMARVAGDDIRTWLLGELRAS